MKAKVRNPKKLLREARLRYEQVCEQLDTLNSEATDLEAEILWLKSIIKNKSKRK